MANTKSSFPNWNTPFLDQGGMLSRVWFEFLLSLAGASDGTQEQIDSIKLVLQQHADKLANHESRLDGLEKLTNASPFGALLAAVLGRLAVLEIQVKGLPAPITPVVGRRDVDDMRKLAGS